MCARLTVIGDDHRIWMVMDFVSKVTNTVAIWWYRFVTSCRALHALYYLPSEQVEAFLDSYNLFEQDNMNADDKQHQRIKAYYAVINHLCAIGIHNPLFSFTKFY